MATTTPNFGWPVPTSTDLVKDGATAIESLGDAIDASLLDLKGGTTGQILSKNSNSDMDFTWASDASGIPATIFDAKGDLIAASAADTAARLAVGTNGQVLTADSTASTGIKWATPSSGGMTLLTSGTLSGTQVNLSSISSGYKNLQLIIRNLRPTNDNVTAGLRFNNDSTASSYFFGTGAGSNDTGSGNRITIGSDIDNGTSTGIIVCNLFDYANTTTFKIGQVMSFVQNATTPANVNYEFYMIGQYKTAAISELNIFTANTTNFTSGDYYLYGVN